MSLRRGDLTAVRRSPHAEADRGAWGRIRRPGFTRRRRSPVVGRGGGKAVELIVWRTQWDEGRQSPNLYFTVS
jgi:hypothetical protein